MTILIATNKVVVLIVFSQLMVTDVLAKYVSLGHHHQEAVSLVNPEELIHTVEQSTPGAKFNPGEIPNQGAVFNPGEIPNQGAVFNPGEIPNQGAAFNPGEIPNQGAAFNPGEIPNQGSVFNPGEIPISDYQYLGFGQKTNTIAGEIISNENKTQHTVEDREDQLRQLLNQERFEAAMDWAPVIWVHHNETFFPGDVHDFLNSTETSGSSLQKEERTGRVYKILPEGPTSEALHLSADIDTDCKNCRLPDFLHGNLPSDGLIRAPMYTHIEECSTNLNNLEYKQIDVHSTLNIDEKRMQGISSQYEEEELLDRDYNFNYQELFPAERMERMKQNFTVTYWSFYPYNKGKEVCTGYVWLLGRVAKPLFRGRCLGEKVHMGNHVGDWEHFSIHFQDGTAKHLYISSHNFGVYYTFNSTSGHFDYVKNEVRKGLPVSVKYPQQIKRENGRIALYSALGSHGLWPERGTHFYNRILVPLKDETTRGYLWKSWEHLEVFNQLATNEETSRQWLKYRGRWGNQKSSCHPALFGFCETNGGPKGINMKKKHFQCDGSFT